MLCWKPGCFINVDGQHFLTDFGRLFFSVSGAERGTRQHTKSLSQKIKPRVFHKEIHSPAALYFLTNCPQACIGDRERDWGESKKKKHIQHTQHSFEVVFGHLMNVSLIYALLER